ncbi:DUF294 nucleotidyltransferase-like domain-containing protein [Bacteroidota bacterium]
MVIEKTGNKYFFIRIILPALSGFLLFTILIFAVMIPSFEENMLDRKRETITELTNSAWSILAEYHKKETEELLPKPEAQLEAVERVKNLRYGEEGKDYFWITDMHPNMIMHPYREELNNTDLSDYSDPEGKRLFVEFVKVVDKSGYGYVDYMWQWKDDSTRIVPKLSYVREFQPWGWIIGTGIYIEDVKEEIANLTSNLIYLSFGILAILALILIYVARQSLNIEYKKQLAEAGLKESEAKYRALVEASTEGLVMILNNEFVYANKTMLELLGLVEGNEIHELLKNSLAQGDENISGVEYFKAVIDGNIPEYQTHAQIKSEDSKLLDVVLYASEISFGEKSGYTIIVKDITSGRSFKDGIESVEHSDNFTDKLRIGLFRTTIDTKGKFIQVNDAAVDLLGFTSKDEVLETNIFDIFPNKMERKAFVNILSQEGIIRNYILSVRKKDGSSKILSVSGVLIKNDNDIPQYCDGIIEDVTEKIRAEEERENLIVELQTSLHFLNEPISHFIKKIASCNMHDTISQAASVMTKMKYSAIMVTSDEGKYIGIVTDRDLRERAVATNIDLNRPVMEVMTSPLLTLKSNALVFEAFLTMYEKSTRHLAVVNNEGAIISMISSEELLHVQRHSSSFIIKEIERTEYPDDLAEIQSRLPVIVKGMIDSGAKASFISKRITAVADAVLIRLVNFAVKELGEPPAKFVFMVLGSQGREEQTLVTDQDNAIIFEDGSTHTNVDAEKYFTKLADSVCKVMNDCGYDFCKGDSMAQNPKWCQPLSKWKEYYKNWIYQSNPQDLLELSIFFDFRPVFGDSRLTDELRRHLFETSEGQAGFFQHLTKNCLEHKVPVGLLGNILLESKGEHPETFNIKNAIMPLTDYARIYAIKNKITETNTLERFERLFNLGIIKQNTYQELLHAYNYLMSLRFKHQSIAVSKNISPDNFISPNEITQIELKTLKNTFTQISSIQKKLSYDFTGEAL